MSKKFMHIMVDDTISDEEANLLSSSLGTLNESYDIAITSSKFQITTFDQDIIYKINDKLDAILENINRFDSIRNDIRSDITYVFGLANKTQGRD